MVLPNVRQELIELLQNEEDQLANNLPLQGFGLMDVARSMDNFWASRSAVYSADGLDREGVVMRMNFGLNKALKLTLLDASKFSTVFLAPTNQQVSTWADTFIQFCGKLGYCENFLELHRVGLCELSKIGEIYRFNITADNTGIEALEKSHFDWAVKVAVRKQKKLYSRKSRERDKISKQMDRMVKPASKHYMTYDTNPRIDNYYIDIGKSEATKMFGRHSFPDHVKFGGIEFHLYCEAVEIMVGWALKHLHFISLLLDRRPQMDFRNLCTLLNFKIDVLGYLQSAVELDSNACKQILDALTLTQDNVDYHCAVPGNFVAPAYIEVGGNKVISPIWGNLSHPFLFLLNELKRRYESDWFDNVNHREKMFRDDIYSFFKGDRFYRHSVQLLIKKGGKVLTDIDALVYDKMTGKIALFQLKSQDFFGYSLRQRSNRKQEMLKANNWVQLITDWILEQSEEEIAQKIGVHDPISKSNFRLFVIGRNAANFSGPEVPDKRAAWGIWLQMHRLSQKFLNSADPIENLFSSIILDSPYQKEKPDVPPEALEIGGKKIIFGKFAELNEANSSL